MCTGPGDLEILLLRNVSEEMYGVKVAVCHDSCRSMCALGDLGVPWCDILLILVSYFILEHTKYFVRTCNSITS